LPQSSSCVVVIILSGVKDGELDASRVRRRIAMKARGAKAQVIEGAAQVVHTIADEHSPEFDGRHNRKLIQNELVRSPVFRYLSMSRKRVALPFRDRSSKCLGVHSRPRELQFHTKEWSVVASGWAGMNHSIPVYLKSRR
jgi:hypothetical protein